MTLIMEIIRTFFIFEGLGKVRWLTDPSMLAGQLDGWLHAVPTGSLSQLYLQRLAIPGDVANGLVSVIIGRLDGTVLQVDLWVMSCRVLKRQMEHAMLDMLVAAARSAGASNITGHYSRTPKNGMVADHYRNMAFQLVSSPDDLDRSTWELDLSTYSPKTTHLRIL